MGRFVFAVGLGAPCFRESTAFWPWYEYGLENKGNVLVASQLIINFLAIFFILRSFLFSGHNAQPPPISQ